MAEFTNIYLQNIHNQKLDFNSIKRALTHWVEKIAGITISRTDNPQGLRELMDKQSTATGHKKFKA